MTTVKKFKKEMYLCSAGLEIRRSLYRNAVCLLFVKGIFTCSVASDL